MVIEVFEVLEVTPNSEWAHSGRNSHEMARLSMASQKGCNNVWFMMTEVSQKVAIQFND